MESRTRGMGTRRRRHVGGALFAAFALALSAGAAGHAPPQAQATDAVVGDCIPGAGWGILRPDYAARVLELVNAHRATVGAPALKTSPTLTAAAAWKALHMAEYTYLAHSDPAPPVARTTGERIAACGYPSSWWGENIASGYPTPETVVQGWLSSSGHRANIENAAYRVIGIGAASSGGAMSWAQDFGAYDDAGTVPQTPTTPTTPTRPTSPPAPAPSRPSAPGSRAAPGSPATPGAPATPTPRGATPTTGAAGRHGLSARLAHPTRRPRAGRRFAAPVLVRSSSGRRVTAGHVGCRATIGKRRVRVVVNAFKRGEAVCAWRVPRWAHGRVFRGLIDVRSRGGKTARIFARRVR
jgi:uncharacterized protein YkwD